MPCRAPPTRSARRSWPWWTARGCSEALALLSRNGFAPSRAFCESALLPAEPGCWHAVLGAGRSFLVEDDGHAVAFDRPNGAEPPLAVRIATDEAAERALRPERLQVFVEPGLALPGSRCCGASAPA